MHRDRARKIWGAKISLQGSGRTDTGVHALGQIASFNAPRLHTATILQRALNANLPRDVRIVQCRLVSPAFHARFDAQGKTYRYLVWNQLVQDPFTLDTHWHVPRPLDLAALRRAARLLLGRHDFASFTSNPGYERETTVRTMKRASVVRDGAALVSILPPTAFSTAWCAIWSARWSRSGWAKFPWTISVKSCAPVPAPKHPPPRPPAASI